MRTRKLLIALILLTPVILAPTHAIAQTLKAVLIIEDDYDDPGLNSIAPSTRMDYGYVSKLLENLDKKGVIGVEKTLVSGAEATRDNIVSTLESIDVGPDDVLLFYFSGHGGMQGGKTFLATSEGGALYRSKVESIVGAKPARLKIVMSDACSASIDGIGPKSSYKAKSGADLESAYVEIYRNLFLNHEGLVYVTSATEGQYAWGGGSGGNFTQSMFYETLLNDPKLTWEEVFEQARDRTEEKFRYMVNMGHISYQDQLKLQMEGVTSQTPKAYSMAYLGSTEAVPIDEEVIEAVETPTPVVGDEPLSFMITNASKKKVTFWVDGNEAFDSSWRIENCAEHTLKKKESVRIKSRDVITVFFDNRGGNVDFYQLEPGSYEFGLDKNKVMTLYRQGEYDVEEIKGPSPIVGTWAWEVWLDELGAYEIVLFTFDEDKSLSVTDLYGNVVMWGKFKSKTKKHAEHLTITLDDGEKVTKQVLLATYLDDDTVMLTDPKGEDSEVVMLYRIALSEYNPATNPAGLYDQAAYQ